MSHGYGALALPYIDEDFSAGLDLRVEISGSGFFTATLPLPIAGAALTYGYYAYGDTTNDIGLALVAALNAAEPFGETWSLVRLPDECVEQYRFQRTSSTEWWFRWTDVLSTLDGEPWGFDNTLDTTSAAIFPPPPGGLRRGFTPWAPGRVWFPPFQLWDRRDPERVTAHSLSYDGVVQKRRYSEGWHHWELRHGPIVEARLFESASNDSDLVQMVSGLKTTDPNYPLESTWQHAATRSPFKWTPDWSGDPDTNHDLEVRDNEWLTRFSEPLELIEGTSPPQWNVTLPMIDYRVSGSSFSLPEVVCTGGAAVVVVTDMPDLFTQAATADVNTVFTASYTPTPMLWDTGTISWTKVNSSTDPYVCLRPRPYEEFTPADLWGSHLVAQYGGPFTISAGGAVFDLTGAEPEDFTFLRAGSWTGLARSRAAYLAPPTSGIVGLRVWMGNPTTAPNTYAMPMVLTDPISDLQSWFSAFRVINLAVIGVQAAAGYTQSFTTLVPTSYSSLASSSRRAAGTLTTCDLRCLTYYRGAPSLGLEAEGNVSSLIGEAASGSVLSFASESAENILGDLLQQQVCLLTTGTIAATHRYYGAAFEFDPLKV